VPVGQSSNHINAILNVLRGSNYVAFTPYLQLHTGDPGAAGTANVSAETDRVSPTFAAPSGGSVTAPAVSWAAWNAGTETITHVSLWDASTAGNFKMSAALTVPKDVENGDTLNITSSVSQGPAAS
jgi:hypothetical protein